MQELVPQRQRGNKTKATHARENTRGGDEPATCQVEANEGAEEGSIEMGLLGWDQNRIFVDLRGEPSDGSKGSGNQRVVVVRMVRRVGGSGG